MANRDRRGAERRGRRAEFLAVCWLRLKGYAILETRARLPVGEIDIIARRGRLVAAIEVKARNTEREALEAVTPRQRARISRALSHFQAARPDLADCGWRFDVMWVGSFTSPRNLIPKHMLDAWRL